MADLPSLIGDDVEVPCVDGRLERYVNLDYAASTPVMADVWAAVEAFVPWYSSVHRGSGVKSQVSTAAFEDARDDVKLFVGARSHHEVVFVRNTTEAINVLAAALPAGSRVLTTRVGLATFTLEGHPHARLAAILSAEHAIGVRHGCFCAHPLISELLGLSRGEVARLSGQLRAGLRPPLPGAVRASMGLGTTPANIERLSGALRAIAGSGPRWRYRYVTEYDEYEPSGTWTRPMGSVQTSTRA